MGIIRDLSDLPEQLKTFSLEQVRKALSPCFPHVFALF